MKMLDTPMKSRPRTQILTGAMALLLAIGMAVVLPSKSSAEDQSSDKMEMKVPQTAMDHSAMAEHYQKKAAEYRADIEAHKAMLAEYKKGAVENPKMGENPHVKAERLHCEKYIKAAEALAAEAAESAKFHSLRAKEMEGK
jgi:uncharacterized protein YlxW (UPF0749 family)